MAVVMCSRIVSKILLLVTLFDALYWINALDGCDRDDAAVTSAGRSCQRPCSHDRPCRNAIRECRCDGICGMSCLKPSRPTPMSTDYSECGVSRYGVPPGLVEGNKVPAAEGAWPWQVYLKIHYTEDPFIYGMCGGTVLRNDTILTTANCVMNFSFLDAFMGITSRIYKGRKYQHRRLTPSDVTIHSRFENVTFSHDIALIHLNQSITLTQNVRAACLPDPERAATLLYTRSAIVTGWGHDGIVNVDEVPDGGYQPVDHLQQLPLPLKPREICEDSLQNDHEAAWWDETMICAGYTTKQFGSCVGDSGGPLIKYANSGGKRRWTIIGITSWGRGCAALDELDFFTNVPYFVDWINQKMNSFQNN